MTLWVGAVECGCECVWPPPPPEPQSNYYYYAGRETGCSCELCQGDVVACDWQIEVTGFTNGPSSGTCTTSTNCANNNGTFILSQAIPAFCSWVSPEFLTSIIQPQSPPIYAYCVDSREAYYRFRIQTISPGFVELLLWLVDSLTGYWQARWSKVVAADANGQIDCNQTFTLDLNDNYIGPGSTPCCCHGAPATIDIVPL